MRRGGFETRPYVVVGRMPSFRRKPESIPLGPWVPARGPQGWLGTSSRFPLILSLWKDAGTTVVGWGMGSVLRRKDGSSKFEVPAHPEPVEGRGKGWSLTLVLLRGLRGQTVPHLPPSRWKGLLDNPLIIKPQLAADVLTGRNAGVGSGSINPVQVAGPEEDLDSVRHLRCLWRAAPGPFLCLHNLTSCISRPSGNQLRTGPRPPGECSRFGADVV